MSVKCLNLTLSRARRPRRAGRTRRRAAVTSPPVVSPAATPMSDHERTYIRVDAHVSRLAALAPVAAALEQWGSGAVAGHRADRLRRPLGRRRRCRRPRARRRPPRTGRDRLRAMFWLGLVALANPLADPAHRGDARWHAPHARSSCARNSPISSADSCSPDGASGSSGRLSFLGLLGLGWLFSAVETDQTPHGRRRGLVRARHGRDGRIRRHRPEQHGGSPDRRRVDGPRPRRRRPPHRRRRRAIHAEQAVRTTTSFSGWTSWPHASSGSSPASARAAAETRRHAQPATPRPRVVVFAHGHQVTYVGHATVHITLDGVRLLTDPVLRTRMGHLRRRRGRVDPAALRGIDTILISHAHYDHLDIPSLERLGRITPIVVPRGYGALVRKRSFAHVVEVEAGETIAIGATLRHRDARRA